MGKLTGRPRGMLAAGLVVLFVMFVRLALLQEFNTEDVENHGEPRSHAAGICVRYHGTQ